MARGQSPYQGRYNFPVASTVERSMQGAANAQAALYQNLGNAFGGVVDQYFKGQDEKKLAESMAENQIALGVVYAGRETVPIERKDRIKDIRGVIRAGGGMENFINRIDKVGLETQVKEMRSLQIGALQRDEKREIQDAQNKERFLARMAGGGPDSPELTRMRKELETLKKPSDTLVKLRGELETLKATPLPPAIFKGVDMAPVGRQREVESLEKRIAEETETAGWRVGQLEKRIAKAAQSGSLYSETHPKKYLERYGDPKTAGEAALVHERSAKLKAAYRPTQAQALRQRITKGPYWSEAEARKDYEKIANFTGVVPTKEELDEYVAQARVIDVKDFRADARRQIGDAGVDAYQAVLENYGQLETLLKQIGNPLTSSAAKVKLARMLEPIGILTEEDIQRVGVSPAVLDQIKQITTEWLTGEDSEENKQYVRDVSEILAKKAAAAMMDDIIRIKTDLGSAYDITEDEVLNKSNLDELWRFIPPDYRTDADGNVVDLLGIVGLSAATGGSPEGAGSTPDIREIPTGGGSSIRVVVTSPESSTP